jgi:hypothetical protein
MFFIEWNIHPILQGPTTNPVVAVHAIVVFGLDLVVVEEILVVLGAVGFVAGVVVVVQVESLVSRPKTTIAWTATTGFVVIFYSFFLFL